MAPINFENNIKDKLDKRTIKPSENAWSKLSERLDNEDKNNKKAYWWFGIAASIIGVLLIVSQFLNNAIKVNDTPILVDTPKVIKDTINTTVFKEDKILNTIVSTTEHKTDSEDKQEIQQVIKARKKKDEVIAVAEVNIILKEERTQFVATPELSKTILTFEDQKIQDVVAQVQIMKAENKVVTDADIDALLEAAQKEIKLNKLYNETTGIVDAMALLQDVEDELDQSSFRIKVFEALKSSYSSVKTAVTQRND